MSVPMQSRWGVQIEGDEIDLANLETKVNGSICAPTSPFVSLADDVLILRRSTWDVANTAEEAFDYAASDLALLQGVINLLDGCAAMQIGTIYEFVGNSFSMTRRSTIDVRIRKNPADLASPQEFGTLVEKLEGEAALREAAAQFVPDPSWGQLYLVWESIERHFGGERAALANASNAADAKRAKVTANSYRHIAKFAPVAKPMLRVEAFAAFGTELKYAAAGLPAPPHRGGFAPGTEIALTNFHCEPERRASLSKAVPTEPVVLFRGTDPVKVEIPIDDLKPR